MKIQTSQFLSVVLFVLLYGCASQHQVLLNGQTSAGEPICLDNRDKIPAVVRKFFDTRDLTTEEGKIDYLLSRVRDSKLIFIRNQVKYDGPSAASFLRWKMNRWKTKGTKIDTAEDFINIITSGSRTSGQPYAVVLQDGSRHNLQPVLQNELNALEHCLKQYPAGNQAKTVSQDAAVSS